MDRVKELMHEGNVTRIVIKDESGKQLLEIPATVGVVGVVIAPWLAAFDIIAALATKCRIVVERREQENYSGGFTTIIKAPAISTITPRKPNKPV